MRMLSDISDDSVVNVKTLFLLFNVVQVVCHVGGLDKFLTLDNKSKL